MRPTYGYPRSLSLRSGGTASRWLTSAKQAISRRSRLTRAFTVPAWLARARSGRDRHGPRRLGGGHGHGQRRRLRGRHHRHLDRRAAASTLEVAEDARGRQGTADRQPRQRTTTGIQSPAGMLQAGHDVHHRQCGPGSPTGTPGSAEACGSSLKPALHLDRRTRPSTADDWTTITGSYDRCPTTADPTPAPGLHRQRRPHRAYTPASTTSSSPRPRTAAAAAGHRRISTDFEDGLRRLGARATASRAHPTVSTDADGARRRAAALVTDRDTRATGIGLDVDRR